MRHPRRETTGNLSVQIQEDAESARRHVICERHPNCFCDVNQANCNTIAHCSGVGECPVQARICRPGMFASGTLAPHGPHEWVHDPTDTIYACPGVKTAEGEHRERLRAAYADEMSSSRTTVNDGAHELLAKLHDEEPVFVIRAQDILSPQALALYADLARKVGLPEHAQEVEARAVQFMQWQARHAKLVKAPD